MKRIICTLMGFAALTAGFDAAAAGRKTSDPEQKEQPTPRLRFTGDPFAQQATAVFAETLHDMRSKIEYGSNERFPAGFFHTSTEPEGVPQYYNDMWTRDCGRGVIELSRLGFADDARLISRYFLAHITDGDHWGRELHHSAPHVELDGNVLILSGICSAWRANGMERELGREFCDGIAPVVAWVDSLTRVSPYGGLLPSTSELSGNPSTDYPVYSIFGNYGIYTVKAQIAAMAEASGRPELAAPAISVDAAPTAAVLEEENSLWELPQADTPDMSNTVWSFAGGYIDGGEMTQAEMDESLAAYGGTLQFTFDAAGGAKMIQGGGTLNGTYQYLDDGSVGVIFDYNGEELRYACIFTWTDEDELLMVAISDVEGADGIYFVQ